MSGRRALVAAAAALMATRASAQGQPIRLLSAGAIEPGVHAAIALWRAGGGAPVDVTFNTAPRITERISAGDRPEVVLAPLPALAPLQQAGAAEGALVPIGAVGVGIAVRAGLPLPAITDAASLAAELRAAEAVVFNRASTGLYFERLVARLELSAVVAAKEVRFPDGDSVMRRIAAGQGREIGFGAITEILLFRDQGVQFGGPLPDGLQNLTHYLGTVVAGAGETARAFLAFLDSPPARAAMAEAGVR